MMFEVFAMIAFAVVVGLAFAVRELRFDRDAYRAEYRRLREFVDSELGREVAESEFFVH